MKGNGRMDGALFACEAVTKWILCLFMIYFQKKTKNDEPIKLFAHFHEKI